MTNREQYIELISKLSKKSLISMLIDQRDAEQKVSLVKCPSCGDDMEFLDPANQQGESSGMYCKSCKHFIGR